MITSLPTINDVEYVVTQRDLYANYYDKVKRVCSRFVRSKMIVEDLIQDTFVKVFERIETFDPQRGSMDSWIYRVAQNTSLMYIRYEAIRNNLDIDDYDVPVNAHIDKQLAHEDLNRLIDTLPDLQRLVFNLHDQEGYDHAEISQLMGVSESSSRANLCRARKKLKVLCAN